MFSILTPSRYSHIPSPIDPKRHEAAGDELTVYVKNRERAGREWIHRPLLYHVLHNSPGDPNYDLAMPAAQRCLELCVEHLFSSIGHHRHHGTWYIARTCVTRVLLLVAAARSCKFSMPQGWKDAIEIALRILSRWAAEAPDLRWAEEVLSCVVGNILEE